MKLWQLKRLSTGESLNQPQPLPDNWGPIFGLQGFKEKLGELSWLGPLYADQGWFEVGEAADVIPSLSKAEEVWNQAKIDLRNSDWAVLPDVPMTKSQREEWFAYRKALREIRLQPGFPNNVAWPALPQ